MVTNNNMNTSTTLYLYILVSLFIILFLSPSSLASLPSSPNTTCQITPYPSFCTTTLPSNYLSIHDQCNFFLQQSLSITNTIFQLISSYLKNHFTIIPYPTLLVLEDCLNLAELNTGFLSNVIQAIETTISNNQVYDLQTLLSAVLTNHQTCLDGFHDLNPYPKITTSLLNHLSDGIKLYSTSLALFTRGWYINAIGGKGSDSTMNNRKLVETNYGDNVTVTKKVIVNPNGSGHFITINDAVNAAPNKTGTNNGYYVIYVVAGIYNEYVFIAKNKENLMIVGDGINRTVITGSRSVLDGWTTFQSATFGKLFNSSNSFTSIMFTNIITYTYKH